VAALPPGQRTRKDFPRFGLPRYAARFPSVLDSSSIEVKVNKGATFRVDMASTDLARSSLEADFHCVTTWSHVGARWRGVSFSDFYEEYIRPRQDSNSPIVAAVLYAQDGYKTSLLLEDLLGANVILADALDDESLTIEHGAPLRLVAPEHYGYKNLKHLSRIEFHAEVPVIKRGMRAFLDHPRARVRREERGRWIPGWILRFLYRPLVPATVNDFHSAMQQYRRERGQHMTKD